MNRFRFCLTFFIFLSVFSVGAFANCTTQYGNTTCDTGSEAYSACLAKQQLAVSQNNLNTPCTLNNSQTGYSLGAWGGIYWFSFSGPPPPPTCSAGTFVPGSWPTGHSGVACHAGCAGEATLPSASAGTPAGLTLTGAQCTASDSASTSVPTTPQVTTCNSDGSSCTYCDNLGNCVTADNPNNTPPPVTGSGTPASSSSAPSTGGSGSGTGTNPSSSSNSGSDTASSTGNGGAQPANNGDYDSNPAHSTSSSCTAGDACNAGQASGVVGTLYQQSGDSVAAEYSNFKATVANSPLVSSATGFFTFTPSGACPTWQIPGNEYWGKDGFTFDFFCTPQFLSILQLAGYLVLAIGAFCAFRIALY